MAPNGPPTDKPAASTAPSTRPEEWLERHGDALYRYAWFRLRDRAAAEDLVQETLLAALQARERFSGQSSERTWLTGILKHKLIDLLRRQARDPARPEVFPPDEQTEALFDAADEDHWRTPPAEWGDPAGALEQTEFWRAFSDCLAALPPQQGQAFRLCEVDGYTAAEACKVLGLTTTNVWVLLHRARLRLRQCLEALWFTGHAQE
jgi:RNA polymerase sigma-70 factor (ECF subfamily)